MICMKQVNIIVCTEISQISWSSYGTLFLILHNSSKTKKIVGTNPNNSKLESLEGAAGCKMNAPESWISRFNQILKSKVRKQTQLRPIIHRRWDCLIMRSPGGNRTVTHPVMRQWESCHIVKDTPWADGGISLSFRTIRWLFGVEWGILRLIVWVSPKQNHVLFDRLITDVRDKWSSFNVY